MTTLKLPRPYSPKLTHREAIVMDCLERLDLVGDGIVTADASLLASITSISADETSELIASLIRRRCILLGTRHVAILSRLSGGLKLERDRNRLRTTRGGSPDWSLQRRVLAAFPSLRGPVERPASYNRPAAFEALLAKFPSYHKSACPANVEIITEACYPGELQSVLTYIAEQESANRSVALLFTRKAVYVGVLRAAKR